jgi:hypothetical protein
VLHTSPRQTVGTAGNPLTLTTVHAHPGDEAASPGGILRKELTSDVVEIDRGRRLTPGKATA